MKKIFFSLLLLTCLSVLAHAQQASAPAAVLLPVNTADISNIELGSQSGWLLFDAGGRRFLYRAETKPLDNAAATVAAGFATLAELRRATKVTLWVRLSADPKETSDILGINFVYDSLKQ